MVKLKKVLAVTLGAALMLGSLAGCGNNSSNTADGGFDATQDISVVSREEGSGTRGAFVELTGVEEKDADGNKPTRYRDCVVIFNNLDDDAKLYILSICGIPSPSKGVVNA